MAGSNLFEALHRRALEAGHVVAAIDGIAPAASTQAGIQSGTLQSEMGPPVQITYTQLYESSELLAAVLASALHEACPGLARGHPDIPVLATWMRRGTGWYCVFWAAVRLQVPLVSLSCDLPDRSVEQQRNSEILAEHRPALLIADREWHLSAVCGARAEGVSAEIPILLFLDVWSRSRAPPREPREVGPALNGTASADAVLCYCYTGGTTKASRCAKITHRMALYEVDTYPRIARLGTEDRVLQQHSLYWGASAYGEVDIALAFGCALVFCEAWDTEGVSTAIRHHRASCAGLVPSVLAALEHRDVPSLKLVFTWGEALLARVARDWAQHVHLLDLLISTECWLSLYADWGDGSRSSSSSSSVGRNGSVSNLTSKKSSREELKPSFRTVPGAVVRLRPVIADGDGSDTSRSSSSGTADAGELLVSGPQVSPGYTDAELSRAAFEIDAAGIRWYCTKDCLERRPDGGFGFAGRADDLVKVGGAWVDVREVEARIFAVRGVAEACICERDVFVVVRELHEGLMQELHTVLPADFTLFMVQTLPRRAGTGKVDRQRLNGLIRVGPIAKRDELEAKLCTKELNSLMRWYGFLILPPLICSIFWAWARQSPLEELLSGAGWHAADCTGGTTAPPGFGICRLDDTSEMFNVSWQILLSSLWVLMQFFCRLLCIIYATMSLYTRSVPDQVLSRFRAWPCGVHGFIVLVNSFVPPPPSYWCLVAPLLGLHGLLHAAYRGRVLSWPLVCLLGLPYWLRRDGSWVFAYGFGEVLWWYWRYLVVGSITSLCQLSLNPVPSLRRKFGVERKCGHCHKYTSIWSGKIDPAVDKNWYCNTCWKHYHSHKQCKNCKQWSIKGATTAEGAWLCSQCEQKARRAAGGLALGNSTVGGSSSSKGPAGGAARTTMTSSNPKSPRTVKIKLLTTAPDVEMEAVPNGRKRAADGSQPHEASPAARRRIADGAISNGVLTEAKDCCNISGSWTSSWGPDVTTLVQNASDIKATNPTQKWSPTSGRIQGLRISMFGIDGTLSGDGNTITWSNGDTWTHKETMNVPPQSVSEELQRRCDAGELTPEGPCKRQKLDGNNNSAHQRGSEESNGKPLVTTVSIPELTPEPVTARKKSREWKIIEKATGMTFNSSSDSVLALDSLRHTKMASALRREAGKRLTRDTLKRAATLQDLLDEVERLPVEEREPAHEPTGGAHREYALWGMMWNSKCQWIFRRNRPLSEPVLRAALVQLMHRHEALRTELRDPLKLFSATQTSLTVFDLWQRYGCYSPGDANSRGNGSCSVFHRLVNAVRRSTVSISQAAVQWSLIHAWPRVGAGPCKPEDVPLRVFDALATAEEADARLWRGGPGKCPPFQASLIAFGKGTSNEGALVHLAVSHMMSDGFCVVPILDDLAYLVAAEERRLSAGAVVTAGGASAVPNGNAVVPPAEALLPPLPPVRSVFEALEARIGETVRSGCVSSIDASGTCITREPIVPKGWFDAACCFGEIPAEVVGALRSAAARLGVPNDIAMLTVLGITLSWFENRKRELIAMIVPQRDGPGHNDMVGLFADVRHLSVCTEGLNFVGVALRLHHVVKERLWSAPGLAMQYDMTFVNFEWTDFEERYGFTQHVNLIERSESSFHPLRISVDQPGRDAWRMRVAFDKKQYNEERRTNFFALFERSLQKFVESPLESVWPDERSAPSATALPVEPGVSQPCREGSNAGSKNGAAKQ